MKDSKENPQAPNFLFLADHPALDLLNTVAVVEGQRTDFLTNDEDVLQWLQKAGFQRGSEETPAHGTLVQAMHTLRETVRGLVAQRKAGGKIEMEPMNRILARTSGHSQLIAKPDGKLELERKYQGAMADQVLAPLTEAITEFVATADFGLVRHCEGEGCILWFYDRTKSRRRRWCSMGICGNRHKVSAYRARKNAE